MDAIKNLWLLVKKNLRILIRSKSSALIVIFAPLLMILLIGLSYSSSASYGLNIGIYAETIGDDIGDLMQSLQEKGFKVVTYQDLDECLDDVKSDFVHACVSLPDDFQIEDNSAKEITFYLDQSKINLVWIIQETLQEEFNLKTQELSESLVSNIFEQISSAQEGIDTENVALEIIRTDNQEIISKSYNLTSGLETLEIGQVEYDSGRDVLDEFQSFSSKNLESADLALDQLESDISKLNMTASQQDDIEDLLSSINEDINDVAALVSGTGQYTFSEVESIFDQLEADLNSANSNLAAASSQVSLTGTELSSLKSSMIEVSNSLSDVSESLEQIKTDLGGFEVSEAEVISSPLITNIETVSSEKSNLDYVFPILLALVVMFLAIMLGCTLVMIEKNSQAYIRNFLVPLGKVITVLATVITNLIIISFQLVIILLISLLFIPSSLMALPMGFIILLISAMVFTFIGMVIGYVFTSEETGILASISTGSLFLFLSGVILPIEGMSPGMREFVSLNPYVITERLLREVFIFNSSFLGILEDLALMLLYSLILFLGIMLIDSLVRKHLLKGILFQKHKKKRKEAKKKKETKSYNFKQQESGTVKNWGFHGAKKPHKKQGFFSKLLNKRGKSKKDQTSK